MITAFWTSDVHFTGWNRPFYVYFTWSGLVIWCLSSHAFHSTQPSNKAKREEKKGYSCRCTDEKKGGLRSAGSDMNEDVQHSGAYGDGETDWQRHHLRRTIRYSGPVWCAPVYYERERTWKQAVALRCVFLWKMQRKDVEMYRIISSVVPARAYIGSCHPMCGGKPPLFPLPDTPDNLQPS